MKHNFILAAIIPVAFLLSCSVPPIQPIQVSYHDKIDRMEKQLNELLMIQRQYDLDRSNEIKANECIQKYSDMQENGEISRSEFVDHVRECNKIRSSPMFGGC